MRSHWRSLISDDGFTLLEVLLAIVIGAIVLTVLYASFFQIIKAKDTAEGALELYHEARVVLSRIAEDLQSAYPRGKVYSDSTNYLYPSFVGKKEGDLSSLSFTSFSREPAINSKDSDQAEIGYYLEPTPESGIFLLIRRENPRIGAGSTGTQYAISDHVVGFNLTYMSDDEGKFIDEWDSTQTASLPRAVEITLTMRGPGGEDVAFSSVVLIPVANGRALADTQPRTGADEGEGE